jgi:hypothetical protein
MIRAMRHRLAEPCHDRKLRSTDSRYSFDVGNNKTSFYAKQNSDTEPQSHIAYRIVLSSVSLICDLAGTFNVLTYTAATYHVADISSTSKGYDTGLRSTLNLPMALMGLHTRLLVSAVTCEVYISFTLFIHVIAL